MIMWHSALNISLDPLPIH